MKWVDINEQKPTLEDCGETFLVAIKLTTYYEYQVCQWWNSGFEDEEPYFNYTESWCGQQTITKKLTHWCKIEEISDFERLDNQFFC
jgi:hypothetical protein